MSQVVDGVDVPCGLCLACKMISDAEGPAGGLEGLGMQLAAAGSRHIFCVLCVCASVPNVDGHHMHASMLPARCSEGHLYLALRSGSNLEIPSKVFSCLCFGSMQTRIPTCTVPLLAAAENGRTASKARRRCPSSAPRRPEWGASGEHVAPPPSHGRAPSAAPHQVVEPPSWPCGGC